VKPLHLGSPGHQLRSLKDTRIVESADFDEHSTRCTFRACSEMNSASLAEMPCRRPGAIPLIERSGGALGELEALSVNRHEEIAGTSRNHLASKAVAQTSH